MINRLFRKPASMPEDTDAEMIDDVALGPKIEDMHGHKAHFCVSSNGVSCRDTLRTVDPLPCGGSEYCGAPVYLVGQVGEPNTRVPGEPPIEPDLNGIRSRKHRREEPIPTKTGILAWMPAATKRGKGKLRYGGTFFQGWTHTAPPEPVVEAAPCATTTTYVTKACPKEVFDPCHPHSTYSMPPPTVNKPKAAPAYVYAP